MASIAPVVEGRYLADISKHIDRHIGSVGYVLHEIVSPTVHVDVHVIAANQQLPYLTIVTSGMSDIDMVPPKGLNPAEDYKLAEIIAFLPADWPIDNLTESSGEEFEPLGWYPIRWLKHYARMPHDRNSVLSWNVSTSNGAPASPIGGGTDMVGFLFAPAIQLGGDGLFVPTHDGRKIRLLNLVPILEDEVQLAIKKGGEALCDKLDKVENFVFDPVRKSCLSQQARKKIFGLF
jgi:Suppressor of fused protein (SUFU)